VSKSTQQNMEMSTLSGEVGGVVGRGWGQRGGGGELMLHSIEWSTETAREVVATKIEEVVVHLLPTSCPVPSKKVVYSVQASSVRERMSRCNGMLMREGSNAHRVRRPPSAGWR